MTQGAQEYMDMLARGYQHAGFPHPKSWAFSPDNDHEERIYNELRARGLIRPLTVQMWVLTEDGLASILRKIPASSEANSIFEGLKRQYVAAGYPHRRTWAFQPDDDSQEAAYGELRARGYIEQLTMAMYILSAAGQQEIMQSDGR